MAGNSNPGKKTMFFFINQKKNLSTLDRGWLGMAAKMASNGSGVRKCKHYTILFP
jgi:hypothetical protein